MTVNNSIEIPCLHCGTTVTLKQPADHSEYVPAATCPKCGILHYATWNEANGIQVHTAYPPERNEP